MTSKKELRNEIKCLEERQQELLGMLNRKRGKAKKLRVMWERNNEMYKFLTEKMNDFFLAMNCFGHSIIDEDDYKEYTKVKSDWYMLFNALVELSGNIYDKESRKYG